MDKPILSARATHYPLSTIRGLTRFAQMTQDKGVKVIPLNLGAPDLPTPLAIKQAGAQFLRKTKAIRYGSSGGDPNLIQEFVSYYKTRLQLPGILPDNLLITQGASEALDLIVYSLTNPGDTILTPDPCYSNYGAIAYKFGVKLSPLPTDLDNGFHLLKAGESDDHAITRLSRYVTKNTKAILWSSPCNPTGAVYSAAELRVLLALARKFNLFLVADEVYRLLSFTSPQSTPIPRSLSILDVAKTRDRDRIIVLDSTSKMISFCGGRVGTVTASQELILNLTNQCSVRGCVSTISQSAVSALNAVDNDYFENNRLELLSRRDYLYQALSQLNHVGISISPLPPEGAFYLVVDLGKGINSANYCEWLLSKYPMLSGSKETVFLTPMRMGSGGFYLAPQVGYSQVRIAYVLEKSLLMRAVAIIRKSLPLYKQHSEDQG